ncbi:ribosomal oxygenase 1-like, partial [Convolutriloba macropyga]|uniref:ribosomal oxygenase 1-like n=1 Tax=Convolutriloba macropyga TaxID=536237 RepID=UPI003F52149A
RAHAGPIWDFYQTGCSIRLLNPQAFCQKVWEKLSYLQEYVGNFCGANVYLTPPGTQGFAPHWDDIEAFVIQLEGCKRWRVYKPTTVLPDYSSHNLDGATLPEPIIDCVLKAGDLLYFPRGYIHQGNALADEHSLHITVSMFQKHSYSHLMSKALPNLVESAKRNSIVSRESLPLDFLNAVGSANIAKNDGSCAQRRDEIIGTMQNFLREMIEQVPSIVDQSADEFALKFIRESLPPCLSNEESNRTILTSGAKWNNESKTVIGVENIVDMDSQLRLVRRHCVRLVAEKDNKTFRLYFSVENTRVYHEVDLKSVEIRLTDAKNVKFLIKKYPKFCSANDLKFGDEEARLELMMGLYEKGILIAKTKF